MLHRILIHDNERIDKPDFDNIFTFFDDDFKAYNRHFLTSGEKWIAKGFNTSVVAGFTFQVAVAGSVLFNTELTNGDEMYLGESTHAVLTGTVSPSTTTYVHLVITQSNTGTPAARVLWDPTLNNGDGGEFLQTVDTEQFLDVTLFTSTAGFINSPDKIPLCTIVSNGVGITSITDNRNLYFRLGRGEPIDTTFDYALGSPSEPASTSFTGGDKDLSSLKDWMDLVMTRIKQISGETYWYVNTGGFNSTDIYTDISNTVISGGGTISYSGANVFAFTSDITLRVIGLAGPITYTIPFASESGQTLGSDQVAYINIDAALGGPASGQRGVSGNRDLVIANRGSVPFDQNIFWIAYRDGTKLFVRGASQELEQGEETQLGDGITGDLLTFIGSTGETDSQPQYSSNVYVADNDSLTTAIGKLDAAIAGAASSSLLTPIGSIIPFYDFNGLLTFDNTKWAYCDGSSVTISGIGAQTLPDLSNRYLVGFGTEGGGDIDTAAFATAAVGNASHAINLQHSHTVNSHSHTVNSHSHTVNSHTHTGPSHNHDSGTLQFEVASVVADFTMTMFDVNGNNVTQFLQITANDGGGAGFRYARMQQGITTTLFTKTGSGNTGSGGTGATGSASPGTDSQSPGTSSSSPGTDSQLSSSQSIQPRSIRVRFIMRIA